MVFSRWWKNNLHFSCSINDGSEDSLAVESWDIFYLRMEVMNLQHGRLSFSLVLFFLFCILYYKSYLYF